MRRLIFWFEAFFYAFYVRIPLRYRRETLTEVIEDLSPLEIPFYAMIGRTPPPPRWKRWLRRLRR